MCGLLQPRGNYSQQVSAASFEWLGQHEYVRTVELSNLCNLDEATANGEKGFRGSWMTDSKISDEKDIVSLQKGILNIVLGPSFVQT